MCVCGWILKQWDVIESGETMKAAGLKAIDTVIESTAVLVKSKDSKQPLVDLITSRIHGVISECRILLLPLFPSTS